MAQGAIRKYKVIVIGGSAGSLDIILKVVSAVQNPDVTFIVAVHRKKDSDSTLSELIAARTKLTVKEVEDKDPVLTGSIYIAPADYHLLLEDQTTFSLDYSEKVHYSRPSIDVTFESVAEVFGTSAVGVLLSGANADGAEGLSKIKKAGGFTIVQDPASADVSFMPQQALELFEPGKIVSGELLPEFINSLL